MSSTMEGLGSRNDPRLSGERVCTAHRPLRGDSVILRREQWCPVL